MLPIPPVFPSLVDTLKWASIIFGPFARCLLTTPLRCPPLVRGGFIRRRNCDSRISEAFHVCRFFEGYLVAAWVFEVFGDLPLGSSQCWNR